MLRIEITSGESTRRISSIFHIYIYIYIYIYVCIYENITKKLVLMSRDFVLNFVGIFNVCIR
jgi:hypothetical protein